jgi:gamma-glutamyltranspeptidase/glutathione hydrolase
VAERGFAVGPRTAAVWALEAPCPEEIGPRAPAAGERIRLPSLAATLRLVAERGPDVIYRGEIAEAIAAVSWLGEGDLGAYTPAWVEPLSHAYRGVQMVELPPPTQGVAALEALALLEGWKPDLAARVASIALATEDALAHVCDGADVRPLLDADHIARRREQTPRTVTAPAGGTAYVAAVDGDGMAVSLIESLYGSFGSGVAVPGSGIVLQNRGSCFNVSGSVEPGRRPYHTIMPGLILRDGDLLGVLGVVGGFMQPQGHAQIVSRLVDDGLDAQAAVDAPRFRVADDRVHLEEGLRSDAHALERLGHRAEVTDEAIFGTASLIVAGDESLFGAADSRGDGSAAGI